MDRLARKSERFDCRQCAACCYGKQGTILVSKESLVRWRRAGRDDILERLEPGHFGQLALSMRSDKACVFLGTPGHDKDCAIYDTRPETCRDFPVGGRQCLEARRERGVGNTTTSAS